MATLFLARMLHLDTSSLAVDHTALAARGAHLIEEASADDLERGWAVACWRRAARVLLLKAVTGTVLARVDHDSWLGLV